MLCLSGRLEAAHLSLFLSGGLMTHFGAVVQPLVLSILDRQHDFPLGDSLAFQLVGDQDADSHYVLNVTETERKSKVQPDRMIKNFRRKAVTGVRNRVGVHPHTLPNSRGAEILQYPWVWTSSVRRGQTSY